LGDEIFTLLGYVVPDGVGEGELADLDFLHDLLIGRTVEGRHTREDDVGDDTARPNIALGSVVLGQNLGGDVVRSTQLLIENRILTEGNRGTEVDDLNLIKLLVLLEQDIFRLKITMHDVVGVTIVNAR